MLTIMTFNVRYEREDKKHLTNPWHERKPLIAEVIKKYNPTIIGTQELETWQYNELLNSIDYLGFGLSREDINSEKAAIFYKSEQLLLLEKNTYWFSDTPNDVSLSWDANLPRIFTYGIFLNKINNQKFLFVNLHLDHLSNLSRTNSIKQIVSFVESKKLPTIIAGDFNMFIENEAFIPLKKILNYTINEGATFHGFEGTREGNPIDFVFYSNEFVLKETKIIYDQKNNKYPSDHYPVLAIFK